MGEEIRESDRGGLIHVSLSLKGEGTRDLTLTLSRKGDGKTSFPYARPKLVFNLMEVLEAAVEVLYELLNLGLVGVFVVKGIPQSGGGVVEGAGAVGELTG